MNTKHITTEEKFYICDGCKVYFSTEEEDDGSIWLIGTRESVSNIRNFYIPNTINGAPVVYIEGDIFDYNNALEHFIVEDDNEYFRMYEGGLYSKDMKKFYFMPPKFDGKVFFVPERVEWIGDTALNAKSLETIVIPEGCQRMIEYSCAGMRSLKRIYIPKSMEFIGFKAFNFTAPEEVFYEGSEEDRTKIDFCDEGFNAGLLNAKWYYDCTIPKSSDEIK
ncbi:leucine-rich repeat protein [uncultured Ruminococcus sp.]|uniref:leucine-rich repeat protein n=1 Tax=uncultured Ruminococcus sp. TaxID=165186 RepID=UPI0025E3950F|nr:leucine-rich repeat protein [uncultured Ruminococcus sp.]